MNSQLNAAMDLLCDQKGIKSSTEYKLPVSGSENQIIADRVFYGKFEHTTCEGMMRRPDTVLMSFGGNDFGFGNIVAWSIIPKTAHKGLLRPIGNFGLKTVAKFADAIPPQAAIASVDKHLSSIYQNLNEALQNILLIAPKSVHMMQYPDPLPEDTNKNSFEACAGRLAVGNESLGQLLADQQILFLSPLRGWVFRPEAKEINAVKNYVCHLRNMQEVSLREQGWQKIDSNEAFYTQLNVKRTWCAVAEECLGQACKFADRFAWYAKLDKENEKQKIIPGLQLTADWQSYTPEMTRGLRTANDAVLTQSILGDLGEQKDHVPEDWIYGIAHPTATIHAQIATQLAKPSKTQSCNQELRE